MLLKSTVQTHKHKYKLLELDAEVEAVLPLGLTLKSPSDAAAVALCTATATYQVRQRNQSSSLLIVSSASSAECTVTGNCTAILELVPLAPSIDVSGVARYDGDLMRVADAGALSVADLRNRSLASDRQFDELWRAMGGCEIDGVARIVEDAFVLELLWEVITEAMADNVPFDDIPRTKLAEWQSAEPAAVVEAAVARFATALPSGNLCLQRREVARFAGVVTLRQHSAARDVPVDVFMKLWREAVPSVLRMGDELALPMLKGNYMVPAGGATVRYLSAESLPRQPRQRFEELLRLKPEWLLDEMAPFIEDLRASHLKLEAFVMRHARRRVVNGQTVVVAK